VKEKMRKIIVVWLVIIMLMGEIVGFVNLSTDAEERDNGDGGIKSVSISQSKS
jgi:hypothetical protein